MKAKRKRPFNVETFLATVDGGRSLSNYRKNQTVFSQGDPADSVFYIREGSVKVCVVIPAREGSGRRSPWREGVLWRGLSERSATSLGDGRSNDGMRNHASGQSVHRARAA
jgi:hypothetical protein